jgi:hypothetical protein
MGIDMNIEHLIGYIKFLFSAKGMYASWDRLGQISAAIVYLQKVKKQVGLALRRYVGSSHTNPELSKLVKKVADKARDISLLSYKPERKHYENTNMKPVVDILAEGEKKLRSSSLKTFNAKLKAFAAGRMMVLRGEPFEEQDDIESPDFCNVTAIDDNEEGM